MTDDKREQHDEERFNDTLQRMLRMRPKPHDLAKKPDASKLEGTKRRDQSEQK